MWEIMDTSLTLAIGTCDLESLDVGQTLLAQA
jgi:hypothetical protein